MKSKLLKYGLHVAGWILFFTPIVIFVFTSPEGDFNFQRLLTPQFFVFCIVYLFLFYINFLLLIPRLYLKKNYALYSSIIIFLFILVYFLRPFDNMAGLNVGPPPALHSAHDEGLRPLRGNQIDIISIVLFIMVWAVSSALCFVKQWQLAIKKAARAEAEKTNAELSYLKAQINPHFLFNTLNSIYSLAIQKSDKTADAVVKLSELMRYVIRDANEDVVSLEQDINYISNYIELQKTRLGNTTTINFLLPTSTAGKKIAPLILISFIENAFKYGVNPDEPSEIRIEISVTGNDLRMFVFNKKVKVFFGETENGIGIENAKSRLQLLYAGKHILKIDDKENSYSVDLTITLT